MLIKKLKEPSPGTLKSGLIRGLKAEPKKLTIPMPISISTQIKKGRSDGQTTLNQSIRPSLAEETASLGYITMQTTSKKKMIENTKVEILFFFMSYL
jgi:hypothetical protein